MIPIETKSISEIPGPRIVKMTKEELMGASPNKHWFRGFITGAVAVLVTLITVFAVIIFTAKWRG
jgi:hypothetical protein